MTPTVRSTAAADYALSRGQSLVLIPGLLCDAFIWQHQLQALAGTHEVVVPILDTFDSIPAMAAEVLESASETFALAGHSLGGRIALEIVRQAPARVRRLALLDTGVHPCAPDEPRQRETLVALANAEGMAALARAWLPPMVHPDRLADRSLMSPLEAMVERRTPATFRNQVAALLARPDAAPVLPTIRCPTLVLCGRQDAWSPLAQHEGMAAAIAGARLAVVDDCGHMAPSERPAEVTLELRQWLAPESAWTGNGGR